MYLTDSLSGLIVIGIIIAESTWMLLGEEGPTLTRIYSPVILVVRTWAIWGRGKRIGYALLAASILAVVPVLVIENIFLKSIVCEFLHTSHLFLFSSPNTSV